MPFSYTGIGASRSKVEQPGYAVDRYHVKLGEGKEAYAWAVSALRGRRQFDLGWLCSFLQTRLL